MDLYPAIDLRAGRCVRLEQGDYERETVYGSDPVAVADGFAAAGATWIHVVDLDAARSGQPENAEVIAAISAAVAGRACVQAGGGVRSEAAAAALAEAGVTRVVIGTAAMEDPRLVARVAARQRAAVGLDARAGEIAVRGWREAGGVRLLDSLAWFADAGVDAFVVTEIGRDGMLAGPDLDGLAAVLERTAVPVIASGGVASLDDLTALAALERSGRCLAGAITGKALYAGRFTLAAALDAAAGR
jgi:phosphoribosylformimino-5-aminoimidazole carboxamide ribotide isomerase